MNLFWKKHQEIFISDTKTSYELKILLKRTFECRRKIASISEHEILRRFLTDAFNSFINESCLKFPIACQDTVLLKLYNTKSRRKVRIVQLFKTGDLDAEVLYELGLVDNTGYRRSPFLVFQDNDIFIKLFCSHTTLSRQFTVGHETSWTFSSDSC